MNIVQIGPDILHLASLNVSQYSHSMFVKTKKLTLAQLYCLNYRLCSDFISFPTNVELDSQKLRCIKNSH